jgi:hypothetical protein
MSSSCWEEIRILLNDEEAAFNITSATTGQREHNVESSSNVEWILARGELS